MIIPNTIITNDLENALDEAALGEIALKIQRIHPADIGAFKMAIFNYMNNGSWLIRTGIGKEVPEECQPLLEAYVYLSMFEDRRVDIVDRKLFLYD